MEAGMYAVTTNPEGNVVIGKYTLCKQCDGQIWIQHESGEAGAFSEVDLESTIESFYNSRF